VTLADDLKDLAAFVVHLESFHDVDVQGAELLEHDADRPVAGLQVVVPERAETETPTGSMYPAETTSAPAQREDTGSPEGDSDPGESDDGTEEAADDGGDHGGGREMAAVDQGDPEDEQPAFSEEPDLTELQQEVVDALAEHGEQPASELQTVTGQNSGIYDRLDALLGKGLIIKRKDPEDGRRSLYALEDEYKPGLEATGETDEAEHRIGDELEDVEDQEASADGGTGAVAHADVDLPDGVTVEDVHDAVDEPGPKPYLGEVADEIGVDRDRTRTIVFQLDRYSDCVDAAEYTGGSD
jgi:DNA-binding MarR family transcriptional regulator